MKVAQLETLYCDAGWRPWIFLKATTDDGSVGWAEITDSHGSPRGLAGIVEDLEPLVVGREPRMVERIVWDLFRATRQSPGSVIQKAIGGIENALLDLKAKALGVPVYELFGGPTRDTVDVYWSHCGTTRARAFEVTGTPLLASDDDVSALGREVVERGFSAFKTNLVVPGDEPQVLHPGFATGAVDEHVSRETVEALERLFEAFEQGTEGKAEPILDLNFNAKPDGALRVAKALERFGLAWLEVDCYEPAALAFVRRRASMPICSGENLYGARAFRPFLEAGALDVASVDVIWNGFAQSKKIADLAETYEVTCAPHNWLRSIQTGIRSHGVAVERREIAQPTTTGAVVILEAGAGRRRERFAVDFEDHPHVDADLAAGVLAYFKLNYASAGYPEDNVLPGGYVCGNPVLYSRLRLLRFLRGLPRSGWDVYGRFGLRFPSETRRRAFQILSSRSDFRYEGSLFRYPGGPDKVPYRKYLFEITRGKVCVDMPNGGDLTFRLVEYLALGACVVRPRGDVGLHVPLVD